MHDTDKPEMVNHPPHYKTAAGIEAIDVIEAFALDFHAGNAVKYILRAGKKDPAKELEDLRKAQWYINRAIETREKRQPAIPSQDALGGASIIKEG